MNESCMTLPLEEAWKIAYYHQEIIQKAVSSPLVRIQIGTANGSMSVLADTIGLLSFREHCTPEALTRHKVLRVLQRLLETAGWCSDHLLDPACLAIHPQAYYRHLDLGHDDVDALLFLYLPIRDPQVSSRTAKHCVTILDCIFGTTVSTLFSSTEISCLAELDLYDAEASLQKVMAIPHEGSMDVPHHTRRDFLRTMRHRMSLMSDIRFLMITVLSAQILLVGSAYAILRSQDRFSGSVLPVALVGGILLIMACCDAVLLMHRSSPLQIRSLLDRTGPRKEEKNLFSIHEEKTGLLTGDGRNNRIAMLSAGIPGTAEEHEGQKAYILVDDFLIGRDRTRVDFRVDSLSVGRIHARIVRRHNAFFIEDLDSKNGTFVDRRKLKKNVEYPLPEKCRLRFAEQEYYFTAS
jgi:hypothetical protein